jgi:hypothetical protein
VFCSEIASACRPRSEAGCMGYAISGSSDGRSSRWMIDLSPTTPNKGSRTRDLVQMLKPVACLGRPWWWGGKASWLMSLGTSLFPAGCGGEGVLGCGVIFFIYCAAGCLGGSCLCGAFPSLLVLAAMVVASSAVSVCLWRRVQPNGAVL